VALFEQRSLPDGTPVLLDEEIGLRLGEHGQGV
jgi:hypothetical protein